MRTPADSIVVGWHGLPAYAARLIKAARGEFPVVATRPVVPIEGMEQILFGRIRWIDEDYDGGWSGLGLSVPTLYFQPSWVTPAFTKLGDEVRRFGGRVVVMFDNKWRGDLRQFLGAVRFRTQWRGRFAAAWVAGNSGQRLARYWGFDDKKIFKGVYGADPAIFESSNTSSLENRVKRFVFVGQLIDRKGLPELLEAWSKFKKGVAGWELHVYGTGPLASLVQKSDVVFHGFQQPEVIARAIHEARFLVLPSREEHWGVVVCEAAQAGCGLLLSDTVGCASDLCNEKNGLIFKNRSAVALAKALSILATWESEKLDEVQNESIRLGLGFTPDSWAQQFERIVKEVS